MWICFNDGFVSAVEDWEPGILRIRARKKEHLEFLNSPIVEGGGTDYRFRCRVKKEDFAELVKNRILGINYGNFKGSVRDRKLHDLYADFWDLHYNYQQTNNR